MTSRISPHAQSPHTTIDYLAALTQSRISSGYLRIPCPAHGGNNPNLALWVNDDGIAARCHSAGCSYADIAAAIETRYGISINPRRYTGNPTTVATKVTNIRQTPEPGPQAQDLRPYALRLWHHSVPIPNSPNHPARMWLANRHLWRPKLPLPGSVRWIGAEHLQREFQGAGAVIAIAAPPAAWLTSWPGLPELSSVQLVYVAGDGTPTVDRGLTKRTYAPATDTVIVLGCPHLQNTAAPVDVAEGLADALALAARSPAPAVATLGTAGMSSVASHPGMGRPRRGQGRPSATRGSATGVSWCAWSTPPAAMPSPSIHRSRTRTPQPQLPPSGSTTLIRPGRSMPGHLLKRRTGPAGRSPRQAMAMCAEATS